MTIHNVTDFDKALSNGPYAWPGGYPLYFVMADGEAMSFKAAEENADRIREGFTDKDPSWTPVAFEVNWENGELYCAHSNERIESAYTE